MNLFDDQFRHAMSAFDWLKGRSLKAHVMCKFDILKQQRPDTEKVRADECADNGRLSGLVVLTSSNNVVFLFVCLPTNNETKPTSFTYMIQAYREDKGLY